MTLALTHCDGTCADCGRPNQVRAGHEEFCSFRCRQAFDERRCARGSLLYDVFMACRHERDLADIIALVAFAARLAREWRREDKRQRDGRQSWRTAVAARALANAPHRESLEPGGSMP